MKGEIFFLMTSLLQTCIRAVQLNPPTTASIPASFVRCLRSTIVLACDVSEAPRFIVHRQWTAVADNKLQS